MRDLRGTRGTASYPPGLFTNLDTPFSLLHISSLISLFRPRPLTRTATYGAEISLGTRSPSPILLNFAGSSGVSEFLMTRETPLDAYKRIYLLPGSSGTRSFGWPVDLLNETGSGLPDVLLIFFEAKTRRPLHFFFFSSTIHSWFFHENEHYIRESKRINSTRLIMAVSSTILYNRRALYYASWLNCSLHPRKLNTNITSYSCSCFSIILKYEHT